MQRKPNSIKPHKHGVEVELDPNFLLHHKIYIHDGEKVIRSTMTVAQVIEGLAFAHISQKRPDKVSVCKVARVEFDEGKFKIHFADTVDNLTF